MRKIGYARVSTLEQNLERQLIALEKEECDVIYQEKISGKKADNRPELQKMLADLQESDTVIIKELTRVSRSTADMLKLVEQITEKGCYIKSLSESWLDTTSPHGKLMLTFFAGLAQFERELMLQRTSEGRAVALDNGVVMGRPKVKNSQMEHALKMYREGEMSIRQICDATGVSKATLCRRIKELKEEKELHEQAV